MALVRSLKFLAAAARRWAFSFEKAISIEIRRVFRKEEEPGTALGEDVSRARTVVDAEIVEDHDVAWLQGRCKLGLDIDLEGSPVHGPFNDPWGGEFAATQARNEGLCAPLSERSTGLQTRPAQGSPPQPAHVRLDGSFIEEDQPARLGLHGGLAIMLPVSPRRLDVSAFLFRRQKRFFYM